VCERALSELNASVNVAVNSLTADPRSERGRSALTNTTLSVGLTGNAGREMADHKIAHEIA